MQKSTGADMKSTDRGHKGCFSETSSLTQQRLLSLKNYRVNTGLIPQNSHLALVKVDPCGHLDGLA